MPVKDLVISKEAPRWLYEALRNIEKNSKGVQQQLVAISRGESPYGGGTSIDLSDYLKLSGRPNQWAHGRNLFDAKSVTAGAGASTTQTGFGFRITTPSTAPTPYTRVDVNIGVEENAATRTLYKIREWVFPNFNELEGDTTGVHFFVDTSDFQTIIRKTFGGDCMYQVDDTLTANHQGITDETRTRILQLKIPGAMATNRNDSTHIMTNTWPVIQFAPMDIRLGQGITTRDKTHTFAIVKTPTSAGVHSTTPFEISGFLYGGDSRRELYSMYGGAKGTLPSPNQGDLVQWNPAVTGLTGNFVLSSPVITGITPDTTGIKVGMRIRQTTDSYILTDDTFVVSVDSSSQITMSQNYPDSDATKIFSCFGPNYISPLSLSSSIDHGMLLGLGDDDHAQYLLLAGRATGQRIGTATASGNSDDIASSGRLMLGDAVYADGTQLYVWRTTTTGITQNLADFRLTVNTTQTVGARTFRGNYYSIAGFGNVTGGTITGEGLKFELSSSIPNTFSGVATFRGINTSVTMTSNASINSIIGCYSLLGGSTAFQGNSLITQFIIGQDIELAPKNAYVNNMIAFRATMNTASPLRGYVSVCRGVDLNTFGITTQFGSSTTTANTVGGTNVLNTVGGGITNMTVGQYVTGTNIPASTYITAIDLGLSTVTLSNNCTGSAAITLTFYGTITNWAGIYRGTGGAMDVGGTVRYARLIDSHPDNIPSQHAGRFYFNPPSPSSYPSPTAWIHIGAGSAAASSAPLKFTSGVVLTTPEAGAIEFLTDDFFITITTGAARKAFILDDGTRLTSGRVPFATTNGRLIDDSDFTFSVDTLTITKIAATTLTGLLTLNDAIDIAVGTTTGTKIATATSQKLGFWNTAPIVQPTTGIAAATFVANTSGIVDDSATFDGYTLGQVVKALRNVGLLA